MLDLQTQLRKFNVAGYTDESVQYSENGKGGSILILTEGDWKYEDEFYGGEPYSGNETLWYEGKVVFRSVYWGKVEKGVDVSTMYDFLRKALKVGPSGGCVHRGPARFTENALTYTNSCIGDITEFSQTEKILLNNDDVYKAFFIGGLVDLRK